MIYWTFLLLGSGFREYQNSTVIRKVKKTKVGIEPIVASINKSSENNNNVDEEDSNEGENADVESDASSTSSSEMDNDEKQKGDKVANQQSPQDIIRQCIYLYVKRIFQGVFSTTTSGFKKMKYEMIQHHMYLSIFFSKIVGIRRWATLFKLITTTSIATLGVELFYDFQSPTNDGTCYSHTNIDDCLSRHSLLDSTKTTCRWQEPQGKVGAMCTFNNNSNYFDRVAFVPIVLMVSFGMGPVMYLLDLVFEYIICAPVVIDEDNPGDFSEKISKAVSQQKQQKKAQKSIKQLCKGIMEHRAMLKFEGDVDLLGEMDRQWGVFLNSEGNEEFFFVDKIMKDITGIIANVDEKVLKIQNELSESQSGMLLIYLFALDLMGRNSPAGKIFSKKADMSISLEAWKVSLFLKAFSLIVLLGINAFAIWKCVDIAEKKILFWDNTVMTGVISYVCIDLFCIEGNKILWVHYLIPSIIADYAREAESIIINTVEKMCNSDDSLKPRGNFSATDYMFVSTRLARKLPGLLESAIVLSYNTPLPLMSGAHWRLGTGNSPVGLLDRKKILGAVQQPQKQAKSKIKGNNAVRPSLEFNTGIRDEEFLPILPHLNITEHSPPGGILPGTFLPAELPYFSKLWLRIQLFLVSFASSYSIEMQKLVIHLLQPPFIGGAVYAAYESIKYFQIVIYILVVAGILLMLIGVAFLSRNTKGLGNHEDDILNKAINGTEDEGGRADRKPMRNGDGLSGMESNQSSSMMQGVIVEEEEIEVEEENDDELAMNPYPYSSIKTSNPSLYSNGMPSLSMAKAPAMSPIELQLSKVEMTLQQKQETIKDLEKKEMILARQKLQWKAQQIQREREQRELREKLKKQEEQLKLKEDEQNELKALIRKREEEMAELEKKKKEEEEMKRREEENDPSKKEGEHSSRNRNRNRNNPSQGNEGKVDDAYLMELNQNFNYENAGYFPGMPFMDGSTFHNDMWGGELGNYPPMMYPQQPFYQEGVEYVNGNPFLVMDDSSYYYQPYDMAAFQTQDEAYQNHQR